MKRRHPRSSMRTTAPSRSDPLQSYFRCPSTRRASKHQPEVSSDTLVRRAQTENAYYAGFVRAVRALPIQQKEAFILAHGEQWDTRALAVAMDCSQEAAANHLREATRVLSSLGGNHFAAFTAQLSHAYL